MLNVIMPQKEIKSFKFSYILISIGIAYGVFGRKHSNNKNNILQHM